MKNDYLFENNLTFREMNIFRAAKMTPDYGYLRKGWLQKVAIFILSLTVQILVVRWFWLKNVQVGPTNFYAKKWKLPEKCLF